MSQQGIDFNRLLSCIEFTVNDYLKDHLEKVRIANINNNRIPLESCIYPLAIDWPSKAYSKKILQEEEEEVEKSVVTNSYRCEALVEEGPILHTLGRVGFSIAEYFTGDLSIKHQRQRTSDIVTIHHAFCWCIPDPEDTDNPTDSCIELETETDLLRYRSIARAFQLPYHIKFTQYKAVRLARLDPLSHEIFRDYRLCDIRSWSIYDYLRANPNIPHLKWIEY